MAQQIQLRRGSAAQWTAANPILALAEMGVETDTMKFKLGDGSTAWNSLGYGGIKGDIGLTGAPGSVWYQGAGAPSSATGVNGDMYLNTSTSDVYQKSAGSWSLIGNIKGTAGSTGATGAGVPIGGTAGQILQKVDATNYNTQWVNPGTAMVDQIQGMMESPSNKTYTLDQHASFAYTITNLDIKTVSGTCTVAININGTPVTGLSSLSVSSVEQNATATAANTVAAGAIVTLAVSSASSPADMSFTLGIKRS